MGCVLYEYNLLYDKKYKEKSQFKKIDKNILVDSFIKTVNLKDYLETEMKNV